MPTLEEIAQEPRIVIDTSFLRISNDPDQAIEELKRYNSFLKSTENIIMIPEVIKEFGINPKHSKKGSKKLKGFVNMGTNPHVKERHHKIESKTAFLKRTAKKLRKREVDFSSLSPYQSLFQAICYLSDVLKIKDKEKRTDEAVVATAFFLTYGSSQRTAILSDDKHIKELLSASIRELTSTPDNIVKNIVNTAKDIGIILYKKLIKFPFRYKVKWDSRNFIPFKSILSYKQQKDLVNLLESAPVLS